MNNQDFVNIVGLETGLIDRDDIDAYINFVGGASYTDGVICLGDVERGFYEDLFKKADPKNKKLERAMCGIIGDSQKSTIPRETRTPMRLEARGLTDYYFGLFVGMGLVSEPRKVRKSSVKYPVLLGYNYFNDPDLYQTTPSGGRVLK